MFNRSIYYVLYLHILHFYFAGQFLFNWLLCVETHLGPDGTNLKQYVYCFYSILAYGSRKEEYLVIEDSLMKLYQCSNSQ